MGEVITQKFPGETPLGEAAWVSYYNVFVEPRASATLTASSSGLIVESLHHGGGKGRLGNKAPTHGPEVRSGRNMDWLMMIGVYTLEVKETTIKKSSSPGIVDEINPY